ncbi:hypothetical protein L208DRAFT_1404715 [Tricholoma matsutake]|nr:hypothetical protein L208DRAFT_1404715 [Tricholoma matsutake 945]
MAIYRKGIIITASTIVLSSWQIMMSKTLKLRCNADGIENFQVSNFNHALLNLMIVVSPLAVS